MTDKDLITEAREACADKLFNRTYEAGLVRRLADALEASTRVPVQGEPNDELIEYALDYIENGTMRPERREALRALALRATVPDAATEELEAQLANAKAGWDSALRIVNEGNEIIKQVGAERDAAVAAIERVRAVLFKRYTGSPGFEDTPEHVKEIDALRDLYGESLADDLLAALDGAPEPEWEWGYRGETLIDVHTRKSRESAEGAVKDLTEYWATQGKKFEVVRHRKAGPWLPVEGEKPSAGEEAQITTGFPKVLIGNATDAVRRLKMTDEELRKLVSDTKGLVADELFFKDDAELITGLSDAVLTLLDRIEKAEQDLGRYDRLLEHTENEYNRLETSHSIQEQALQRVRELHAKHENTIHTRPEWVCAHRHCVDDSMDQNAWPCPTIRALEGDDE